MINSNKKTWFSNWANEYDETLGKVKRHHKLLDLVVEISNVRKNDRVLDIGCGTGLLSLKFLSKADCQIKGVDSSPEMLEIFNDKITKLGLGQKIHSEHQDAESLNFEKNSFDIVASTVTLHHVKNKLPAVRNIRKMLKPEGKFILGDLNIDTTGDLTDSKRMLRIMGYLLDEYVLAMEEGGLKAFNRMYDNGKRHILNDGEYCISFKQWKEICQEARFKKIRIVPLPDFKWFKVLIATK